MMVIDFIHWLLSLSVWATTAVLVGGVAAALFILGGLTKGFFVILDRITKWWDRRRAWARLHAMLPGMSAADVQANRQEIRSLSDRAFGS